MNRNMAILGSLMLLGTTGCSERMSSSRTPTPSATTVSAGPGVIPAGTNLEVRTNESINADRSVPGQTYSAEVARDIVRDNGSMLIPRGSPVELVVLSRNVNGAPELELGVRSITINGQKYQVNTDEVKRRGGEGIGKNRRTAEMVGGGAVLGTLLGAVAGGAKGAAIGAAVGAAGGAAVQVLTKGKEVRIPAETVLSFRLDQPMYLASLR